MSSLISTLSYQAGQIIIAKALAHNVKGWSLESTENIVGIVAQTIPTQAPMNFILTPSSITSVNLSWSAELTNSSCGYSPVTNYTIIFDQGTNTWVNYDQTSSDSYSIQGLSQGVVYQYRVQANNIYGAGPVSNVLSSVAAQ